MPRLKLLKTLCGLDEAGRGALAGPLVAAAVILPCSRHKITHLAKTKIRDSKLLSVKQQKRLYRTLRKVNPAIAVEVVSTLQINHHGIGWANKQAFRRLIRSLPADAYIIDGNLKIGRVKGKVGKIRSLVDADATIPEVMLASIVAKVERDKLMRALHRQFPRYHWRTNMGYGTRQHLRAIQTYNLTRYHRRVFVTTALRKLNSTN